MGHNHPAVGSPADDPYFRPPVDVSGAEARAYEEAIVRLLRNAISPGAVDSIEIRGERPNTEIVLHTPATSDAPAQTFKVALWKDEYPTEGLERDKLADVASVAGFIYSDWTANELKPVDDG
jgi:hypothetical protein